jgi:predicted ATP-dependent protease
LLDNPAAWDALKRSIKNREIRTEEIGTQLQLVTTVTLEPESIPLSVKVLLIGDPVTFYLLHELDEDFRKHFKVQADFGSDIERNAESIQSYAQFIAARCHQEELAPFESAAVARVVEYGSRLAEHQSKLATRFGEIADLLREASYWAKKNDRSKTTAADVQAAIDERTYRANRAEHRMQDLIDDGVLRVDVAGSAVGQVNGLSVLALGNHTFGKPSRITVRTYTGKAGVVSLDREAKLSGRLYDKGLLTITGYLGGKYALDAPLSLSATISFEQLHDEIDGDSASSAELYALLSSLSGIPLKCGIAVTGAVDQQGNVLPVGGVNEKIEGFFETCHRRELTGEQGVIIPEKNVVNLMLKAPVRQAVEEGSFHIYAVKTLDEGLEILTGVTAGKLQEDGTYPAGSVHGRAVERLQEISENLKPKDSDGNGEQEGITQSDEPEVDHGLPVGDAHRGG